MSNRADRRASAKFAKGAAKRARTPTEAAIARAAGAFATQQSVEDFGSHLSARDFDTAWERLGNDLHDILDERFPEFRALVYSEAGTQALRLTGANGTERDVEARLFLCPVAGAPERVRAFTASAEDARRLETSLVEAGVVAEGGQCLLLPALVPVSAFFPDAAGPGRVRALHDALADRLAARLAGEPSSDGIPAPLAALFEPEEDEGGILFGALAGIEFVPATRAPGTEVPESELESEAMARTAAEASWNDAFAADLGPDLALGAPQDWPACAAALAWERVRVPLDAAQRDRGWPQEMPGTLHGGPTADGERLVFAALFPNGALGPFETPAELVWFDADSFFDRAATGTRELVEHESDRPVLAALRG